MKAAGTTLKSRATFIYQNQGLLGFYRGIVPGSQSVFLRNGAAMLVMQHFNRKLTKMGLRE